MFVVQAPLRKEAISDPVLLEQYDDLVDNVVPEPVISHLYAAGIINNDVKQQIEAEPVTTNQVLEQMYRFCIKNIYLNSIIN